MAINIKNIIDAIEAKVAAGSTTFIETMTLLDAVQTVNNSTGAKSYEIEGDLPSYDSSYQGNIIFVRYKGVDDYGSFYYGKNSSEGWARLISMADSDELVALALANEPAAAAADPTTFPGSTYGYLAGGVTAPGSAPSNNATLSIEKFSLTSDGNSSAHSNLATARGLAGGHTARTDARGYVSGGLTFPFWNTTTNIDAFLFASSSNAVTAAYLATSPGKQRMTANSSQTHGYSQGGQAPGVSNDNSQTNSGYTERSRFAFNTGQSTSVDIGDLANFVINTATSQNNTHGYIAGGHSHPGLQGTKYTIAESITKFSFSADAILAISQKLSRSFENAAGGISSYEHGYAVGGTHRALSRFPFSNDQNASNVADLLNQINSTYGEWKYNRVEGATVSGTTHGYIAGGGVDGYFRTAGSSTIHKFPYASESLQASVGTLTVNHNGRASSQV